MQNRKIFKQKSNFLVYEKKTHFNKLKCVKKYILTSKMHKGRKVSGGKYRKGRKKKLYELAGQKRTVRLGEEKRKSKRIRGGNKKTFLLKAKFINVITKDGNKKTEIKNVAETPSNRFLARQNVITKGTVVETDLGKVRVTNRPSQEGVVNGILIE